jgi:hypothetical protein
MQSDLIVFDNWLCEFEMYKGLKSCFWLSYDIIWLSLNTINIPLKPYCIESNYSQNFKGHQKTAVIISH